MLNQIDGKDSLTEEEILEIKNNPNKYDDLLSSYEIKKIRELPKNICFSNGYYFYSKYITRTFDEEIFAKDYILLLQKRVPEIHKHLEKTEIVYDEEIGYSFVIKVGTSGELEKLEMIADAVNKYVPELDEMMQQRKIHNIDKYRNEDGFATLKVYNGKSRSYLKLQVDDEDWKDFVHYTSNMAGKYPVISLGQLHVVIFKKNFPLEYENRKENDTVNHKNRNIMDATLKNLHLASRSLQAQNRDVPRNSLISYTGVHVRCGSFYAKYKAIKKCLFDTVEKAAREYNRLALLDDENSRLNIVPDTETKIIDIYGKDNLMDVDISQLNNVGDIKEIIRTNNWNKEFGIAKLESVGKKNLEIYKKKIIAKLETYR